MPMAEAPPLRVCIFTHIERAADAAEADKRRAFVLELLRIPAILQAEAHESGRRQETPNAAVLAGDPQYRNPDDPLRMPIALRGGKNVAARDLRTDETEAEIEADLHAAYAAAANT